MNRVNLLINKVSGQRTAVGAVIDGGSGGPTDGGGLLINITLIIWAVIALYFWQSHNISKLKKKSSENRSRVSLLKENVEKLKINSEKAKEAQGRINGLKKRRELLKDLSKSRVDALKSLDYLQSIIPERVWLNRLDYLKGKLTFQGFAVADEDLNLFMERLELGRVFVDINPVNVAEAGVGKGKSFTLTCHLENI